MHRSFRYGLILLTLLLIAGLGVRTASRLPHARAQALTDTFVGRVDGTGKSDANGQLMDGTDAFIGIVSNGQNILAYVCDGFQNTTGDFFEGTIDQAGGGVLTLSADNGDQLTLTADATTLPQLLAPDGALTGTFTNVGGTFAYTMTAAADPAGLYQGEQHLSDGTVMEGGTVVLNDGESRGSASISLRGASGGGRPPTNVGFAGIGQSGGTPRLTPNPFVNSGQFAPFTGALVSQPHGTGGVVLPITLNQFTAPLPFNRQTAGTLVVVTAMRPFNRMGRTITFVILETGFTTPVLTVARGELITLLVQNNGRTFHNVHLLRVRGDDGAPLASNMLAGGESDTMTFSMDQPGDYTFVDDTNPNAIFGRLTVS